MRKKGAVGVDPKKEGKKKKYKSSRELFKTSYPSGGV